MIPLNLSYFKTKEKILIMNNKDEHCIASGKITNCISPNSTKKYEVFNCVKCGKEISGKDFWSWKIINTENGKGICVTCNGSSEDIA